MSTTAPKRSIKTRLKHRTPEIILGASAIAGVVGFIYIRKNLDPTLAQAFASHAADSGVELITGNEEAFVTMSTAALETLSKFGSLEISDQETFKYVLSIVDKN